MLHTWNSPQANNDSVLLGTGSSSCFEAERTFASFDLCAGEAVYFAIVCLVWSADFPGPGQSPSVSTDSPVEWTHSQPFCYPTFAWQTPWRTCISPETAECVLCACDLQGRSHESKLSSFPLLKDNLGDICHWALEVIACPPILTVPGVLATPSTVCRPRSQCSGSTRTFGLPRGKAHSTFGQGLALPRSQQKSSHKALRVLCL